MLGILALIEVKDQASEAVVYRERFLYGSGCEPPPMVYVPVEPGRTYRVDITLKKVYLPLYPKAAGVTYEEILTNEGVVEVVVPKDRSQITINVIRLIKDHTKW